MLSSTAFNLVVMRLSRLKVCLRQAHLVVLTVTLQMAVDLLLCPWLRVSHRPVNGSFSERTPAGAEFAEFVIQAAFEGKKTKTVQAYVSLSADAGGEGIKKEIGSDIEYFSVNIELGVRILPLEDRRILTLIALFL